jgi:hypothetical protein
MRESALILALYAAWQYIGSLSIGGLDQADAAGLWLADVESFLRWPSEAAMQQAVLGNEAIIRFADFYYTTAHIPVFLIALVWVLLLRRDSWAFTRTTVAITMAVCLRAHPGRKPVRRDAIYPYCRGRRNHPAHPFAATFAIPASQGSVQHRYECVSLASGIDLTARRKCITDEVNPRVQSAQVRGQFTQRYSPARQNNGVNLNRHCGQLRVHLANAHFTRDDPAYLLTEPEGDPGYLKASHDPANRIPAQQRCRGKGRVDDGHLMTA